MTHSIAQLLSRSEGKTLEFKRDLSSPRNILKTLVAFANTAGGRLLIGVEAGSRELLSIENPLDEEERLCSLIVSSNGAAVLAACSKKQRLSGFLSLR